MGGLEPADPKVPGPKTIKRKRKTEQKLCITKKKPKTNLSEKKKLQKTVKNPKKTKNN